MGFVDADTHVIETEITWTYLDPADRQYKPIAIVTDGETPERAMWLVGDQILPRNRPGGALAQVSHDVVDVGFDVRAGCDIPRRLEWMDRLGVETQVIYPTFFTTTNIKRPEVEVALAKAYNRWMADVHAASGGRIRWTVVIAPDSLTESLAQLAFGRRHGACGVFMKPIEKFQTLIQPYWDPIYHAAQDLDIPICVHVGSTDATLRALSRNTTVYSVVPAIATFQSILMSELPTRFPTLRFGFIEAGAMWVPWALIEAARGSPDGARRRGKMDVSALESKRLFVSCTIDDDLPYLLRYSGPNNLVLGTDFGHVDRSADLMAHQILVQRMDVEPAILRNIVDENARQLYGLESAKVTTTTQI